MKRRKLFVFVFLVIFLISCNTKHCIKYENDKYGNFEYCYDATKSEIEEAPVMTDQSSGTSIIGVGLDLLDQLGDALGNTLASKTLNYKSSKSEPKLKRLKRLLNEYKRRKYNNAEK